MTEATNETGAENVPSDEPTEASDPEEASEEAESGPRGPTVLKAPEELADPLREVLDQRECRILDASVVGRISELSEAMTRAENRARQVVEEARREAETIREEAREQGRREGYEELVSEIAEVRERYRQIQDEAEEDMLELAFRIARRLVGRELERDPAVVRDIVDRALERVRGKRQVVVRVHPTDAEELEPHTEQFSEKLDGAAVYVEPDEGIDRGGCVLETDANRVDARLDVQLERLRDVLTDS